MIILGYLKKVGGPAGVIVSKKGNGWSIIGSI